MDFEANHINKDINAIQEQIATKKKVRRASEGLSIARVLTVAAITGERERRRPRREEEGARRTCREKEA